MAAAKEAPTPQPEKALLQQFGPMGVLGLLVTGGFGFQINSTSDISTRLTAVEIKLERLDEIRLSLKGLDGALTKKVNDLSERMIRLETRVKALEAK